MTGAPAHLPGLEEGHWPALSGASQGRGCQKAGKPGWGPPGLQGRPELLLLVPWSLDQVGPGGQG